MKASIEFKALAVIFALLVLSVIASQYWGVFASKPGMTALQLISFDKKIGETGNACYSFEAMPLNLPKKIISFEEIVLDKITRKAEFELDGKLLQENNCIDSSNFMQGNNFVELRIGDDRLFFNVEKTNAVERLEPSISIQSITNGKAVIKIEDNDLLGFEPLTIYVNGIKDHAIYPKKENEVIEEKINLMNGENKVSIEFKKAKAETTYFKQAEFSMNAFIGIALIVLLLAVFMMFVFSEKPFIEKIAFSLAAMFISLMALVYALLLADVLSIESLLIGILAIIIGIAVVLRKNFKTSNEKISLKKFHALGLLLVAFILFSGFLFYFFSPHYLSIWTNFYERQTELIVKEKALLAEDPLSFLGTKPNGYISGYFFLNAGIALLTGLENQQYFAITQLLAKLFILLTGLVLFKSLKFSSEKTSIGMLLFFMTGFVFGDVLFSARHLIALGLGFLGITAIIKEKPWQAALLLAFATFIQAPVFLLALIAVIALISKKQARHAFKGITLAGITSLVLFAPILLAFGLPIQAEITTWGHLGVLPLYGVFVDLLAPILFIALFLSPYILKKEIKPDAFSKKLLAAIIVLLFIQAFISYRVNVVNAFLIATLLAYVFPEKVLKSKQVNYAITAALIIGLGIAFSVGLGFGVPESVLDAGNFVKGNTSTNAKLLVEPVLGHSLAFFGERKVLSDLAVEYSSAEMIEDSYTFLKESRKEIIDKYSIDYVVNRRNQITEQPVGNDFFERVLEFEFLDKVYSNGYAFVHANP